MIFSENRFPLFGIMLQAHTLTRNDEGPGFLPGLFSWCGGHGVAALHCYAMGTTALR
jgi:hypothetical protein